MKKSNKFHRIQNQFHGMVRGSSKKIQIHCEPIHDPSFLNPLLQRHGQRTDSRFDRRDPLAISFFVSFESLKNPHIHLHPSHCHPSSITSIYQENQFLSNRNDIHQGRGITSDLILPQLQIFQFVHLSKPFIHF